MVYMSNLEEMFWARVWRCTHRHPCKRCCWPWRPALLRAVDRHLVPDYGLFSVRDHPQLLIRAHRMALAIRHHALLLPFGQHVPACHLCDFASCCNDAHIVLGTPHDNIGGTAKRTWLRKNRGPVLLPDGSPFLPWHRLLKLPEGMLR